MKPHRAAALAFVALGDSIIRFWDWIERVLVGFFEWAAEQHWTIQVLVLYAIVALLGLAIYLSGAGLPSSDNLKLRHPRFQIQTLTPELRQYLHGSDACRWAAALPSGDGFRRLKRCCTS